MSSQQFSLTSVATFKDLTPESLRLLEERLQPLLIGRGDCVVRQGEDADALYVVVSGRFAVEIEGHAEPVAEISHGSTIGEIAFFAGGDRTATVRAIRDGVVVGLTRADFDAISSRSPAIWTADDGDARRTPRGGDAPSHAGKPRRPHRSRSAAAAHDRPSWRGWRSIPPTFLTAFVEVARSASGNACRFERHDRRRARRPMRQRSRSHGSTERARKPVFGTVVFVADRELTPWSEKSVRQADELLMVAAPLDESNRDDRALSPLEAFALSLHRPASRRLVIVHGRQEYCTRHAPLARACANPRCTTTSRSAKPTTSRGCGASSPEKPWASSLAAAAPTAPRTSASIALFAKSGIGFDLIGGTSGGAAMGAAFAQDLDPLEIDAGVHRMFIDGRALATLHAAAIRPARSHAFRCPSRKGIRQHPHRGSCGNPTSLYPPTSPTTRSKSIAAAICGARSAPVRRYRACCRRTIPTTAGCSSMAPSSPTCRSKRCTV